MFLVVIPVSDCTTWWQRHLCEQLAQGC